MKVTVQLFGAFRPFGERITIELSDGADVSHVRAAFTAALPSEVHELIALSRFADARTVLAEDAPLDADSILAILPPVSGG